MLRKKGKTKKREILKNQLIQKAQQYFTNIASIFEVNWDSKDPLLRLHLLRNMSE